MKKLNVMVWLLSIVALLGSVGYFYYSHDRGNHQNDNQTKYIFMCNGLCNQMRQYMFGEYLKNKFKCNVKFISLFDKKTDRKYSLWPYTMSEKIEFVPASVLDDIDFKISAGAHVKDLFNHQPLLSKKFIEKIKNKPVEPRDYQANDIDVYYTAAPWLEKEYDKLRDKFIKDFTLKIPLNDANKAMLEKIKSCNSVSMHIRRTDFVKLNKEAKDIESYHRAAKHIAKKVKDPHFFIFSDDIKWCKENLKLKYPHTFVDINGIDEGYFDLELMKNCKHNITARYSTFSHMASWLNENPDKIVIRERDLFTNFEIFIDSLIHGEIFAKLLEKIKMFTSIVK